MTVRVSIKAVRGDLSGKEFQFMEQASCIAGRDEECQICFPETPLNRTISRKHCVFEIHPPNIFVRDLGSRNGTWVNGNNISQRSLNQKAEEVREVKYLEYLLTDGDEVRIGENVFRIEISNTSSSTVREIRLDSIERQEPEEQLRCIICGHPLAGNPGENESVCPTCMDNPFQLANYLIGMANLGDKTLATLKGFILRKKIGQGGMGVIYLLENPESGKKIALKLMKPGSWTDEVSRKRFIRESLINGSLKHPNIVELYENGFYCGIMYFTLEYLNGGNLHELVFKKGPLDPETAVHITLQALDGLEYGHNFEFQYLQEDGSVRSTKGLVHRDIKPSNILLQTEGEKRIAKVADFGLAKAFALSGQSGLTRTGSSAGTPWFIPRQQILDFKHATSEVDIWSMAATLYFMLTGKYPREFQEKQDPYVIITQKSAVPIGKRNSAVPEKLAQVIDKALIDDPEIVFKTVPEFRKALIEAI